jgi:hypothetical protein
MYVMTRVLKDNLVVKRSTKHKIEATIEYMVAKMDLVLQAPEDVVIKEGDTVDSKIQCELILCRE